LTVVGITGKYCSGKSTVAAILRDHGYVEIDVDALGHDALQEHRERVVETFGPGVLSPDGTIDRRALGAIVFRDRQALRRLEEIVHPSMVAAARRRVESLRAGGASEAPRGVVLNAAILFRMGMDELCDRVIYVTAPLLSRWRRARNRDGAGLLTVLRRLRLQTDVHPQFSRFGADILTVRNDGSTAALASRLSDVLRPQAGGVAWSDTGFC